MSTINTVQVSQPMQSDIVETNFGESAKELGKTIKDRFIGDEDGNLTKDGIIDAIKKAVSDERSKDKHIGDESGNLTKEGTAAAVNNETAATAVKEVVSDERLKDIFGSDDVVSNFAKINAYEFKYKPKALKLYKGTNGVDEGTNVGVMAQELEKNPVTENVVTENENGHKVLDTNKLTAANSAVLSDVCKRLINIERTLGIETDKNDIRDL